MGSCLRAGACRRQTLQHSLPSVAYTLLKPAFLPQSVFLGFICLSQACEVWTGEEHAASRSRVYLLDFSERNSRVFERVLVVLAFLFNLSCRQFWCTLRISMKRENKLDATQWFYWTYNSLNMFRAPLCPSSGATDSTDVRSMWHINLVLAGWGMLLDSSSIPQPGRITYSLTPNQQPAITKVMCHCVASSWFSRFISSTMHGQTNKQTFIKFENL